MSAAGSDPLVGIFIGGASSRMGRTKGLLPAPRADRRLEALPGAAPEQDGAPSRLVKSNTELPDETIVERTVRVVRAALPRASICLVGNRSEFDPLGLERIEDARQKTGPLGGLVSLLRACERRNLSAALVLGSDFPFLSESLVGRLASEAPHASVLSPFIDDRYQPLVARYSVATLPVFEAALDGSRWGLQGPLRELGAVPLRLKLGDDKAITDWDNPEDITNG